MTMRNTKMKRAEVRDTAEGPCGMVWCMVGQSRGDGTGMGVLVLNKTTEGATPDGLLGQLNRSLARRPHHDDPHRYRRGLPSVPLLSQIWLLALPHVWARALAMKKEGDTSNRGPNPICGVPGIALCHRAFSEPSRPGWLWLQLS